MVDTSLAGGGLAAARPDQRPNAPVGSADREGSGPVLQIASAQAARVGGREVPSAVARPIARPGTLRILLRNPAAAVGLAILFTVAVVALLAPLVFPGDPLDIAGPALLRPGTNAAFPFGTDSLGRNVAAGLAHGARITLTIGLAAAGLGLLIGVLVGSVAGYFGGRLDDLLVKLTEIFQTVPPFVLMIVLVAIFQPTVPTIITAIGIVSWPGVARVVRAEFRSLRNKDFVVAARGLGFGHRRIIFREILPNALPPIIVTASVMVAGAILAESAMSFLGLSDANAVSWGSMIGMGREQIRTAWYLTAIPGIAIVLTVLALNLIGDGLNDALNPRLSRSR
ncbi:MAG: ABC transporter permease [Bauldia sp.]|nr:ABC transporter permease [Bauldia sp.]